MQTMVTRERSNTSVIDPVEEMRLRTWARRHYAPASDRDSSWHPIVLEEMARRDLESGDLSRRSR